MLVVLGVTIDDKPIFIPHYGNLERKLKASCTKQSKTLLVLWTKKHRYLLWNL